MINIPLGGLISKHCLNKPATFTKPRRLLSGGSSGIHMGPLRPSSPHYDREAETKKETISELETHPFSTPNVVCIKTTVTSTLSVTVSCLEPNVRPGMTEPSKSLHAPSERPSPTISDCQTPYHP